jgi:F-type H+-transporting ATPase subunit b
MPSSPRSRSLLRRLALAAAAAGGLVAAALPASAEEHAAEGGHAPNPLAVNVTVAVATIVVFLLLLAVLKKAAWKPILQGLRAREEGIRTQIEGAEKANADAKALLSEYERRIAEANAQAQQIVEEGRRDAEALRARMNADAVAEAAKERERAVRDIELARDAALEDLHERVAVLATDVAGRILQARLDPAQHKRLVDEAVAAYEGSRKAPGARA